MREAENSRPTNDSLLGGALSTQQATTSKLKDALTQLEQTKDTGRFTAATLEQDREKIKRIDQVRGDAGSGEARRGRGISSWACSVVVFCRTLVMPSTPHLSRPTAAACARMQGLDEVESELEISRKLITRFMKRIYTDRVRNPETWTVGCLPAAASHTRTAAAHARHRPSAGHHRLHDAGGAWARGHHRLRDAQPRPEYLQRARRRHPRHPGRDDAVVHAAGHAVRLARAMTRRGGDGRGLDLRRHCGVFPWQRGRGSHHSRPGQLEASSKAVSAASRISSRGSSTDAYAQACTALRSSAQRARRQPPAAV
jgi:hypothetical protein